MAHGYAKISITELDKKLCSRKPVIRWFYTGTIRNGLEGTHVYKKDGYYYLYCTLRRLDGIQVALRSKHIYGPYQERVVLRIPYPV